MKFRGRPRASSPHRRSLIPAPIQPNERRVRRPTVKGRAGEGRPMPADLPGQGGSIGQSRREEQPEEQPMVKLVFCLRRLPHLSRDDFQRYWREQHAPWSPVTRMRCASDAATQLHTRTDDVNAALRASRGGPEEYDGIAELWWRDRDDLLAATASEAGQQASRELLRTSAASSTSPTPPLARRRDRDPRPLNWFPDRRTSAARSTTRPLGDDEHLLRATTALEEGRGRDAPGGESVAGGSWSCRGGSERVAQ